ncbi:MAG TPA: four-carbon acid sugar kinase family protein [Solirubrobacterales bacterium]|nr:four-carbon acid sugar kinase family protein [Solirubrobacterales bacterium]
MAGTNRAVTILADDLTGAADAALPFARHRETVIGLAGATPRVGDVRALSSESRDVGPEAARRRLAAAMPTPPPGSIFYKKVDSLLRGNTARELAQTMAATGARKAILAPALPHLGRVVRHGFSCRPDGRRTDIGALLAEASLGAAVVAAGDPDLAARIAADPADVLIADATTEGELRDLAAAALAAPEPPMLAGAHSFAAALADLLHPPGRDRPRPTLPVDRVLLVLGSPNEVLRGQLRFLLARSGLPSFALGEVPERPPARLVLESIQAGAEPDGGAKAKALAAEVARLTARAEFDVLLCSGGAVAAAVCQALGVRELRLCGELGPGFPLAEPLQGQAPPLLGLRSGSFGAEPDLWQAYRRLGESRRPG